MNSSLLFSYIFLDFSPKVRVYLVCGCTFKRETQVKQESRRKFIEGKLGLERETKKL
jgi:hypothetical protein